MVLLNWLWGKVVELINYFDYALRNYQWVFYACLGMSIFLLYSGVKNLIWSIKDNDKEKYSSNFRDAALGVGLLLILVSTNR